MSCDLYEIGTSVHVKTSMRVDVGGATVDVPFGAAGQVEHIDREGHLLRVRIPSLGTVITVPAGDVFTE